MFAKEIAFIYSTLLSCLIYCSSNLMQLPIHAASHSHPLFGPQPMKNGTLMKSPEPLSQSPSMAPPLF